MWIKFIHVILMTILLGLSFSSFFYTRQALKSRDPVLYAFTLRLALTLEIFIFLPAFFVLLFTGLKLVKIFEFSYQTPWIIAAYSLLGLLLLLRVGILNFLYRQYVAIKKGKWLVFSKTYYVLQIVFWMIFILIMRDAITHSTYFGWS